MSNCVVFGCVVFGCVVFGCVELLSHNGVFELCLLNYVVFLLC